MAVPKRKTTPSKRKQRRSHDAITCPNVVTEQTTGEYTLPHHISVNGYYRGKKVLVMNEKKKK